MFIVRALAERLRRLGDAARASDQLAEEDREARNRAIEEADLEGWSNREIGRWVGMSPSAVHGIIVARTAARQAAAARAVGLR